MEIEAKLAAASAGGGAGFASAAAAARMTKREIAVLELELKELRTEVVATERARDVVDKTAAELSELQAATEARLQIVEGDSARLAAESVGNMAGNERDDSSFRIEDWIEEDSGGGAKSKKGCC